MFLMIDNYDSFVYNLARYFTEVGEKIDVIRNDRITLQEVEKYQGIIISPGPKSPEDCGMSAEIVRKFAGQVPILGVCLGHQIIANVFGARVQKGVKPMHGKLSSIHHNKQGLFEALPEDYLVTRYHSLVVDAESIPSCLETDAFAEDGALMALHHRQYPVYGVQFHPEAAMTEYGHALVQNFIKISNVWRNQSCVK